MLKSLLVYSTCFPFAKTIFILNLSCQRTFHCHNISSEVHYPNHTTSIIRLWKAVSQVGLFSDDPMASEDIRRGCEGFIWLLKRIRKVPVIFEKDNDGFRRYPKTSSENSATCAVSCDWKRHRTKTWEMDALGYGLYMVSVYVYG